MKIGTGTTDSNWVVVDTPGWIEYLSDGDKADAFAPYLESTGNLLVPSIVVYEVYDKICREQSKATGSMFLAQAFALGARVIPLSQELSILAVDANLAAHLRITRAIIYATAQAHHAQLVTSDPSFSNLPGVTIV